MDSKAFITRAERDAIRAVIDTPEKWTREALARAENGDRVGPNENTAIRWSLTGAIIRGIRTIRGRRRARAFISEFLKEFYPYLSWQDSRTHAEVLALLDGLPVVEEVANGR